MATKVVTAWSKEVMGMAGLYLEEAFKNIGQGKVGPQLLVCDVVLVLSQPFCPEAGVPLPQLLLEALEGTHHNNCQAPFKISSW